MTARGWKHYLEIWDRNPVLGLAVGAVMISFSAVWVRVATVPATTSGFYRMFFGAMILMVIIVLRRRRLWVGSGHLSLVILAAVWFALDLFFWHRSILIVGPGLSTLLANFQVFFLAAWGAVFLRERLGPRRIGAIAMAVMGVGLVSGIHEVPVTDLPIAGIVYGLLTALSYTGYLLVLRRIQIRRKTLDAMANLFLVSVATAGMLAGSATVEGISLAIPDAANGTALVAYGLFSQVLGWVCIARCLPRVSASVAGLILLLQPTLSFVWDVAFFHRPCDIIAVIGVAMAVAAIYLGRPTPQRGPDGPVRRSKFIGQR